MSTIGRWTTTQDSECRVEGCSDPVNVRKAGLCKRCYHRQWKADNPLRWAVLMANANTRARLPAERDCARCGASGVKRPKSTCQKCRASYPKRALLRQYGLTLEEYEALAEAQHFECAICRQHKRLVVDHDHATLKVRGLLCHGCNAAIGALGDTAEGVGRAVRYLDGVGGASF